MNASLLCCCCLLRPPEKNLKTEYYRFGRPEVYTDMLKECFEIHLTLETTDPGICETCIARLRDACDFKTQVQTCQKELSKAKLLVKDEKGNAAVKEEPIYPDDNEMDMKLEPLDYEIEYLESGSDDDTKLADLLGLSKEPLQQRDRKKRNGKKSEKLIPRKLKLRLGEISSKNIDLKFVHLTENKKHKLNIDNILKHSNCTPFSTKSLLGILCAFCKENFKDINSLRSHYVSKHSDDSIAEKKQDKNNISIKIDITNLKCNLCNENFDRISVLKTHLTNKHDVKFYDVFDYILEFKLTEGEILNCALCNSQYETFKMLLQHMNKHYRNYICELCDLGFINRHRLKNHQKTHEVGNFKCLYCDKIFTTKTRKDCHEKYTHNTNVRYKTNCPQCDQSFTSYYQRNRHMYIEHNVVAATYKCTICDKSFILKSKLTSHIKKVHLMERNHICPECGQEFFNKQALDEHMVKHNGERVFKCTFCQKAYARKKTLREHLRIHNNDRRFKCGLCGLAFVQKCSLKSHMLSNHGVSLAEFENKVEAAVE